ncbi:Wzz/FepE/Etk N-terminal domain-containing protein [Vibrio parahaemolyticus]|uniref:Regulator of length of O-antigen component of lipopolysaccharide chains n=1 Tax=Vibrio parahaemolyticus TaxID=670 RepID=A0A5P4S8K0_VIBPH|nr:MULTISPECIES: Wzz/FepE/Etk N-terminal domain-containing protein [Vibrio]QFC18263.1 regulator of length of O-antigen component of lipopolysaccharide chains [Vibrio parahaemolyticus]
MEPQKEPSPNYLPYPPQPQSTGDEIDLRELCKALWEGKWIIIITTFIFAIGSVLYALSLPNIYKADTLLAPADTSNGGGLSKMAGQLGGLAALAGVNFGGSESSQTDLAVQVMKSRQFIDTFIKNHNLLVPLMASEGWDLATNSLILDSDVYDVTSSKWLRDPNGLRGVKPTAQEIYEKFIKKILIINKDEETGFYTISVKHYSPYIAQQWTKWLIEDINKTMRERAIAEAEQNLTYLNIQLNKTAITDMQSTFYKLIEEQTKSLMLAEVQEEFVFKVIDPALVPEVKDTPRRGLICIIGTLIGGIISVLIILVLFVYRKENIKVV